jgi:glycosyltransferase involved in cell wall biosynthesis
MHKALVILTPGFPKNERDSTCMPDRQIFVKALKESNPAIDIVVLAFQYPFYAAEYQWNGVRVIALGGKDKGRIYREITWIRAWRVLKKLNRQYQVTGLLSFWLGECAFVGHRFSKQYKLKHYCWILGQDAKASNKYVKWIKPTGENLIALSDFIAREFNKNYGIKPQHLIPGAVDISLFKSPPPERNIDVMGAGSLIPLKQYDVFIDIVWSLKRDFPNIKTVICGKGPEVGSLQHKINMLGLEDNIALLGELPHAKVLELMQRAKVFMHTSNYEGFGVVCLEALYADAKVVSFVRPMDADIPNWNIAENTDMMEKIVKSCLNDADSSYGPVLPYAVSDTVKAIVKLFS